MYRADCGSSQLPEPSADQNSDNAVSVARHGGRGNILLLDGHVESNRRGKFSEDAGKYNWYVQGLHLLPGPTLTPEPTEPN